jgi:diacylglycerol kinase (CTP)
MKPHEEVLEIRRKTVHLIIGFLVASLLWLQYIDAILLLCISFFLLGFFLLLREFHCKAPTVFTLLRLFEREKHIKKFPGKSAICFLFACAITAFIFPRDIAVASILILAFGDAISNLIGHHFGRTTTPLHPIKKIEGPLVAICIAAFAASFFVPFWYAVIAATVAMILEFPEWVIFGVHVDDNLIIPLSSGLTLLLLMW